MLDALRNLNTKCAIQHFVLVIFQINLNLCALLLQ